MLKKNQFIMMLLARKKVLIWIFVVLLIITLLYFCVPVAVYPDSIGYYNYLKIFKGIDPISTWGLVRGPSLPILLFIFVSVFGSAMIGILAGTYIFFVGLLTTFYLTLTKIIKRLELSRRTKIIAIFLFVCLVVFNPILFGYFHALLTEFVATFFALASCLLSWVWLKVDFSKQKIKYILYNILFAFIFVFMWFLKQPYFTIALFPLVIACIISVIKSFKLVNIIQRIGTLIVCILCLFLAISGWRSYLASNGVDYKAASSVDDYYLSGGIIKGLSNADLAKEYVIDSKQVIGSKYLSTTEKDEIVRIIKAQSTGGAERVKILTVKSPSGVIIDEIPIFQENQTFTVKESTNTWLKVATQHPLVVLDSYVSNYLAAIDIYNFTIDPPTGIMTPVKKVFIYGHENYSIGLLYLHYPANMDTWTRDQMTLPGLDYIKNKPNIIIKLVFGAFWKVYQVIYALFFLLLPIMLIYAILKYKRLSKDKEKNHAVAYVYEMVIIIFGFSFLHVLFNVVLGAMIDRYIFVAFPGVALGFILLLVTNQRFVGSIYKLKPKMFRKRKR